MNCDPNELSKNASCLLCGLSDDQLSQSLLYLLCQWANSPGASSSFPVAAMTGLVLRNESSDFDSISNGTQITAWNDLSGNAHHWASVGSGPLVDQTIKANGHATVRFTGAAPVRDLRQVAFFTAGYTGVEFMIVGKQDIDPPVGNAGPFCMFNQAIDFPDHEPFSDGNVYSQFGQNARPNMGNPTTSFAGAFRLFNIAVAGTNDLLDAWLDTENFYHVTGGYTFDVTGNFSGFGYNVGWGFWVSGAQTFTLTGNVAAIFVWNRRLSTTERAQMRTYCNSKYGTAA